MIRFDRDEQWAATQFAEATDPRIEPWEAPRRTHPGRRPYIPLGCDQQSRLVPTLQATVRPCHDQQPEAAHAAGALLESDFETPEPDFDTHDNDGGAFVIPALIGVVAAIALFVHLASSAGWLL